MKATSELKDLLFEAETLARGNGQFDLANRLRGLFVFDLPKVRALVDELLLDDDATVEPAQKLHEAPPSPESGAGVKP